MSMSISIPFSHICSYSVSIQHNVRNSMYVYCTVYSVHKSISFFTFSEVKHRIQSVNNFGVESQAAHIKSEWKIHIELLETAILHIPEWIWTFELTTVNKICLIVVLHMSIVWTPYAILLQKNIEMNFPSFPSH